MTSRGTALVTDSTCYLTDAVTRGVRIVPLSVTLEDRSWAEPDLPPAEFYALLAEASARGVRPTTSQPPPGSFLAAFTAAAAAGHDRVLCLTAAATMSGTHRSATLAAGMSDVAVDVVDSGTVSGGLALVVAEVLAALAGGSTHAQCLDLARSLGSRIASTFVSDSLPLFAAGGRYLPTGTEAGVPVLAVEGAVRTLGHARDVAEALALQVEVVRAAAAAHPTPVAVGHGNVPDLADALADAVAGVPGVTRVDRYVVGPVIGAHVGAGNVGLSYLRP